MHFLTFLLPLSHIPYLETILFSNQKCVTIITLYFYNQNDPGISQTRPNFVILEFFVAV